MSDRFVNVFGGALVFASLLGLFTDSSEWPGWAVLLAGAGCIVASAAVVVWLERRAQQ